MKRTILLLPVVALAVGCASHDERRSENRTNYDEAWYQSQAIPVGRVPVDQMPSDQETVAKGEPGEFVHVKSTKEEASSPVQTAEAKTEPPPAGTTEQPVKVWTTESPSAPATAVGAPAEETQVITGTEVQGPPAPPAIEAVPTAPPVEPAEPVTPPPAETPVVPPQP